MNTRENLSAWQVFVAVAEHGSISKAAVRCDLDAPAASRLLTALETEVGFQLVNRTVRPFTLTGKGFSLLPSARSLLAAAQNCDTQILRLANDANTIRLSFPANVTRRDLIPMLDDYRRIDPELQVEVVTDKDHTDVLDGRIQAAYLPYWPPEAGLEIITTGTCSNFLLASPDYLARHGTPKTPADLIRHTVILRTSRFYPLTSELVSGSTRVPLTAGRVMTLGDAPTILAAALSGIGIAVDLSIGICTDAIDKGELVPVLRHWHRPQWEMCIVTQRASEQSERLHRFVEWFAKTESEKLKTRWQSVYRRFNVEPD